MNARYLLALVPVALVACGADEPDAAPASTTPPSESASADSESTAPGSTAPGSTTTSTAAAEGPVELDGREFVSTEVVGYELVPDTQVRLSFEGDRIGANAGCNQLNSTWALEGDVLVVDEMAATMMACEPAALMDQDTWLSFFLTSEPQAALEGETLTLSVGSSSITLVDTEVAEPDQSLEGPTWTLESIVTADSVSSINMGSQPATLAFAGGEVAVNTGCNTGSGGYDATNTEITFAPIALTLRACEPPVADAEAAIISVLGGTVTYEIDADQLTLTKGDQGLVYRAG